MGYDKNLPQELKDILDRLDAEREAEERAVQESINQAISNICGDSSAVWGAQERKADFRPLAKVVSSKSILLFVPEVFFSNGWDGFKRARQEAINWMLSHRSEITGAYNVGDGFTLEETPLYFLEPNKIPVVPRMIHYNAAIDSPELFDTACKLAHIEQKDAMKKL